MANLNNNKMIHRVVPMNLMLKHRGDNASSSKKKLSQELTYSYNLNKAKKDQDR